MVNRICTSNDDKGTSPSIHSLIQRLSPKMNQSLESQIKVDGAVNSKGVGIRMIITSPHDKYKGYRSIKLDSHPSNNQAEYEAFIIGMTWALATGIQALKAYSDFQVVVSQVNDEFTVHSKNLKTYVEKANNLKTKFCYIELRKISRLENEAAERLDKIMSGETPNDEGIEIEFHSSLHSISHSDKWDSRKALRSIR